jgi:hypothetical protein
MADRNGYIGRAPSDSSVVVARQTFQPTGITTTFTFASGYTIGYFDVFLNGAKQIEGQDYDANNGSTFDVSGGGATNGDVIEAVAYKAFNVSAIKDAPGDFTVGNNLTVAGNATISGTISGDGSALTGVAGGKFSANDTGISTTTSVGIGTTNATGAADSNNTAVLNVGVVTANFFYGNGSGLTGIAGTENIITGTAATFTNVVKVGTAITLDATSGIITVVNGFVGDLTGTASLASNLTGTPDITVNNITGVAATFTGILTYDDVTNVDSLGIVTARSGVELGAAGVGGTFSASGFGSLEGGLNVAGVVTATTGSFSGTVTANSFSGDGSGLTGVAAGINTTAATVAGIVTTLDLSSAQDHKITVSGISTVTVKGGAEGESHTVRIINSGITTVGFSTFFLFPSGADPSMPTADGAISLISFTVNRVGAGGTQLLAGAALNYS